MEIKIYFFRFDDEEREDLTYSMIELLFSEIEDQLHYLPPMDFDGKKKLKITFFNLSKREMDVILEIVLPEVSEKPEAFIRRVICSQPKGENPQDRVFMFTPPGFRTKEDEERAEERKKHGMDIIRMVRRTNYASAEALYDLFKKDNPKWKLPPLTTKAYLIMSIPEEDEDEIIRRIASEPMPKNRRVRPPRPRKPAAPKLREAHRSR